MMDTFEITYNNTTPTYHKAIYNGDEYEVDKLPENIVFDGSINLFDVRLSRLPNMSTWTIKGDFNCSRNDLSSLKGCPKEVGGSFVCYNNEILSLEGCPKEVGGSFRCCHCNITSLEYSPSYVGGDFWCDDNKITSLKGSPKEIYGNFSCTHNELQSLEHGPEKVGYSFRCHNNKLSSLKGCPKEIDHCFYFQNNNIETIDFWPEYISGMVCYHCDNPPIFAKRGITPLEYLIEFYKNGLFNSKELLMKEFGVNSEEELKAYLIMMDKLDG